jgi:hypothetical protein
VWAAHYNDKEPNHAQGCPCNLCVEARESPATSRNQRLISRPKFLIIAVLVVLAIVAIVVGAVLGSRLHNGSSSSSTTPPSSSPESTATGTLTATGPTPTSSSSSSSLRGNSAIAVTGWTATSGFSIRLFYQGGDGKVRLSKYESSTLEWESPMVLEIGAKNGTSLGVSSLYQQAYYGFTNDKSVCPQSINQVPVGR